MDKIVSFYVIRLSLTYFIHTSHVCVDFSDEILRDIVWPVEIGSVTWLFPRHISREILWKLIHSKDK